MKRLSNFLLIIPALIFTSLVFLTLSFSAVKQVIFTSEEINFTGYNLLELNSGIYTAALVLIIIALVIEVGLIVMEILSLKPYVMNALAILNTILLCIAGSFLIFALPSFRNISGLSEETLSQDFGAYLSSLTIYIAAIFNLTYAFFKK